MPRSIIHIFFQVQFKEISAVFSPRAAKQPVAQGRMLYVKKKRRGQEPAELWVLKLF